MMEEIITFETAKLAKEKGFNSCNKLGSYNKEGNYMYEIVTDSETIAAYGLLPSPTQSLLQKWLREVHSLSVKIDDYITNSRVRYDYSVSDLGSQEDNPTGVFETYEEALEQGLQEALSLIK